MFAKILPAAVIAHCLTGVAFAQAPRQVRFEYERQEGAAACPEIEVMEAGVAARLGYEPFHAQAEDHLRATMRKSGRGLEARIEMTDAQGNLKAERRLFSRQGDCAELASSVQLALSIAIDPFHTGQAALPPPGQATPPAAGSPAVPTSAEPPEPSIPISGVVELGIVGGIGSAPARTLGARVGAGIRRGRLSLGIEGRADLPASVPLRVGDASTSLLVASLIPCVRFRALAGCALVTGGALRAAGHGLVDPRQVTFPYMALGARIAFATPITTQLSLMIHGDLTAPLTQTELRVDDLEIWTSPVIALALGLGVAAHFP